MYYFYFPNTTVLAPLHAGAGRHTPAAVVSIDLIRAHLVQWSISTRSNAFYLLCHSWSKTVQWRMKEVVVVVVVVFISLYP